MCCCTVFALFYFGLIESNFRVEAPGENSSEVFLYYEFGGLIFGEVYTWRSLFYGILWNLTLISPINVIPKTGERSSTGGPQIDI